MPSRSQGTGTDLHVGLSRTTREGLAVAWAAESYSVGAPRKRRLMRKRRCAGLAAERFADMIERHWDGIVSYCHPNNKVSLGMVEGINNKIRVLQRRAYGYHDDDYLHLKIVAAFLPPLPQHGSSDPL